MDDEDGGGGDKARQKYGINSPKGKPAPTPSIQKKPSNKLGLPPLQGEKEM